MARKLIVVGDSLSHGGSVKAGAAMARIDGRAIARIGDPVECSVHGSGEIAEGEPAYLVEGRPVALEGHKTSCGATLIGSVKAGHG